MRSLKEYMAEGFLDRVKNKEVNHDALIKEFLEANYDIRGSYVIKASNKGPVVDVEGYAGVENTNITSLTNGLFEFGVVSGDFNCAVCKSLKSLEGAPKKIGGWFDCSYCKSLTSLIGCPKEVEEYFHCHNCGVKFTEEDVRKHIKVVKNIYI